MLGILVEIMVRINLKEQPLVASKIMNRIMDVFNVEIIYTCIGFMITAEIVKILIQKFSKLEFDSPLQTDDSKMIHPLSKKYILSQRVTKRRYVKEAILGIMIVLAIYMGSFLRPEMHEVDKLKKANPADQKLQIRFDRFHSKFVNIYSINMILGLSLLYIHGKEMARFRERPTETHE